MTVKFIFLVGEINMETIRHEAKIDVLKGSNCFRHTGHKAVRFSVCPPVAAVPWRATIIQPSVVKTESDVMTTIKTPLLTSKTLLQSTCHAEEGQRSSHAHTGLTLL